MTTDTARFAVPFRRLARPGYRGPVLLAGLLSVVVLAPGGGLHGALTGAGFMGGMLVMLALMLWVPLLVVLAVLAATVAWATATGRLARPRRPGNSVLLGCVLGVAALLLGTSVPGGDPALMALGAGVLLALPVGWLVWQQLPAVKGAGRPVDAGWRGAWRWAVPPLLVAAGVLLVAHDVPGDTRFALSRPALTAFAERTLATGGAGTEWVAGYRLERAELVDGGVKFEVAGTGVFAPHGYAYFPAGTPTGHPENYYALDDRWPGWYGWSGPDRF